MDKIVVWWRAHRPSRRRLIQLYAALLTNAHARGFIEGEIYTGNIKSICVPGLNCYSCPGAIGACPLGALQNALASSGHRAPYYVLGILMLFGLTLGRTICGWLCPFGLLQDLLAKFPAPKLKKSAVTRALSLVKYVLLAVLVVIVPLMYSLQQYPVPAFCKYICPTGTLEGAIGLLSHPENAEKLSMLGILFTRKFILLALILTACIFIRRAFCRFLCPLGAIYGIFNRIALLGVKLDARSCTHCGRCTACCPMDIRHVGDRECISCGECISACPHDAISWKCGGIKLRGRTEAAPPKRARRRVIAALMLALLLGVMLYVNFPKEPPAPLPTEPKPQVAMQPLQSLDGKPATPMRIEAMKPADAKTGIEIGMRAPDFTAERYGTEERSFTLSQQRGKVVVINFWATWCTPCIAELPHFERVYAQWPEDVSVIALHSQLVTDDVQAFIDREGYALPFGLDADGSIIRSFGGSTMLPMTVILDREGNIAYNRVASVAFEELESIITPLL